MGMNGHFLWYDLLTSDLEAAKSFYAKAVGWETERWGDEGSPYFMWMAGDTSVGGVMALPRETEQEWGPPRWWAHVVVDDVDAAAARAEELGGRIRTPPTDIPDVGRYAMIHDPQGAEISLFRPDQEAPAPDRMQRGGVGWHELHTSDHDSAWTFYAELLGWRHTGSMDMGPAGTYFMFGHPDEPEDVSLGGMFSPDAMTTPPFWLYYFNVDDIDQAVARIRDAGGQIMSGPDEVPGGMVASCMDPQGGRFAVYAFGEGQAG